MIANANYEGLAAAAAAASSGQIHSSSAAGTVGGGAADKRPYYGKCQYKTGKCFNERTLKRNGDAHSLCEEHRIKQNLIQRRSDRKYQTVHAIRRRERSQRRAVLKKQVSMAVAQQLFYEHQQQKSIGMQQLSAGHPLSVLAPAHSHQQLHHPLHSVASLAPPIQIPGKMDLSHFASAPPASFLSSAEGLASPILSFAVPPTSASSRSNFVGEATEQQRDHKMEDGEDEDDEEEAYEDEDDGDDDDEREGSRSRHSSLLQPPQHQQNRLKQTQQSTVDHVKEENASPTGIDDFAPDSFLSICVSEEESDAAYANLVPIMSTMGDKEMWTEDDIEFLQNLLLA